MPRNLAWSAKSPVACDALLLPPLLFDLDGTLVDSLPDIAASVNHVRASRSLPELPMAEVRSMVGDGLSRLLERALPGVRDDDLRRSQQVYRAHHAEQCVRLVQPFPGVREHLRRWHDLDWPMAVVTNKPAEFAAPMLDALALRPFFAVLVDGDSVAAKKPSPEPCLRALRELGAAPECGTMIGDSVQDLRAGKAAGLRTTAALFGYREASVLRAEGADQYWTAFGEPER